MFEKEGVEIAKEYDTPGWTAENAQKEADQAITALGKEGFAAIYAANDETGGGAIAAMKGAGINPEEKPVTGQDSTVAGLQRILNGEQFMTIFKPIVPEAEIAAEMAISLGETGEVKTKEKTEDDQQRQDRSSVGPADLDSGHQRKHQRNGYRRKIRHPGGTV